MGESERADAAPLDAPEARRGEGSRTVVVVDDDPAIRSFVASALRASGYEVVTASDGRAAMRLVFGSSTTPALLLSDIEMQELVRQLEECQSPRTCPHGRPTMIQLSASELEKAFGRI